MTREPSIESQQLRTELARAARRVVVKVGSNVLAAERLGLDAAVMAGLVGEVSRLVEGGREVVLVTSGAILAGRVLLGMEERPRLLPEKQACAAVGQPELIGRYRELFGWYGKLVSQVLLTAEDLRERRRYLNARNTLRALLDRKVIPIVNENDTVSVEEIKFGDNDMLSSLVASLVEADMLVVLSDVEGFYTADPRIDSEARLLGHVESIGADERARAGASAGTHGLGGMASKLEAAARLLKAGIPTVVAPGKRPGSLTAVLDGADVGTLFHSRTAERLSRRKLWLAYVAHPKGSLVLDEGACRALREKGKSLLPSGVREVGGRFEPGDAVVCSDPSGQEVARGLVNYSSEEVSRIKGCHSSAIEKILGYKDYDEVIHRDNLALR
ncbi:MAG: glutamate 5-kinase [Candidatus Wallbacteria bacterium]|nr:glutamate 5-kinase [Candidatus Wallbacteria bacterium]